MLAWMQRTGLCWYYFDGIRIFPGQYLYYLWMWMDLLLLNPKTWKTLTLRTSNYPKTPARCAFQRHWQSASPTKRRQSTLAPRQISRPSCYTGRQNMAKMHISFSTGKITRIPSISSLNIMFDCFCLKANSTLYLYYFWCLYKLPNSRMSLVAVLLSLCLNIPPPQLTDIRTHRHHNSPPPQLTTITTHRHHNSPPSQLTTITTYRHHNSPISQLTAIKTHRHHNSPPSQ